MAADCTHIPTEVCVIRVTAKLLCSSKCLNSFSFQILHLQLLQKFPFFSPLIRKIQHEKPILGIIHSTTCHSCHYITVIKYLNYAFTPSAISPMSTLSVTAAAVLFFCRKMCPDILCDYNKSSNSTKKSRRISVFTWCCHDESR